MSTTIPKPNRMTQNKHTTKNQLSRKQIDKCRIFYDCRSSRSADEQNSMWYWFPLTSSKHVHKSQFPIWLEQEEHRTAAAAAAFIQGASNVNKTLFTNSFKQGKNRGENSRRSVFKLTLLFFLICGINPLSTDIQIYFVKPLWSNIIQQQRESVLHKYIPVCIGDCIQLQKTDTMMQNWIVLGEDDSNTISYETRA